MLPVPIMTLDSQTIYVFSTLSLLGIAALVALAAASYPDELRASGRLWSGATLVLGLGMAAIALRDFLPSTLSVLAAHTFGIAGLSGLHHALTRFAGGRVRPFALYAPVLIAAASSTYFLLVQPSYAWRVAVFSLIGAARARRKELTLSVALLDLDHLKAINDTEGHALGDEALLCVARSLARGLRTQDAFGRWGGDEFLVVLPDTDLVGAEEACERVRTLVAESGRAGPDGAPGYSVSIGIACRRGAELDLDRLVMEADRALYASKQSGRNAVWSAQPAVPHPVVPGRVSPSLVLPVSLGSPES